jgi:glyceraldehyde 3-phosphate dehydrogenase
MASIGRLVLRSAFGGIRRPESDPRAGNRLDVVHINELKGGIAAAAHLLEFDSIHGRWHESIGVEADSSIALVKKSVGFSEHTSPGDVAWGDLGCDVVLECTGKFLKPDQLQAYFDRGVKRVIVAAPVKDDAALNIVVGVNDQLYDPARHRLLTRRHARELAPVVKVIHESIESGTDRSHDPRSTIPTSSSMTAQGSSTCKISDAFDATYDHRECHRYLADLPGA